MNDNGVIMLVLIIALIGGVFLGLNASDRDNARARTKNCALLYTYYAKTTADSLWMINNKICPSPAEVRETVH